eukprot:evm.model.NODE_37437_length_30217_cov_24.682034.2
MVRSLKVAAKALSQIQSILGPVSWLSALFGGSGSSQPKAHRPFGAHEKAHLKLATRKKDKVMQTNPGARVEPDFLPVDESQALVEEALDVVKKYGISHVNEEQRNEMAHQLKHFPLPKADLKDLVNMRRVTGHKAMDPRRVAEVSWLPGKDIDVDLPARALLHLSGDARYSWCHGIRLGVTHPQIEDYYLGAELPEEARVLEGGEKGEVPLWDWWGNMKNLRRRGPERLSVIFAFADPEQS